MTWTPTATWTPTPTWTATWTPVVQTVIVTQPPQIIEVPRMVTVPPQVIAPAIRPLPQVERPRSSPQPLPTQLTPFYGWRRYQSIHLIAVVGQWGIQSDARASARQYRQSTNAFAIARYPFEGEGLRLAYKLQEQGCTFDLYLDDTWLITISTQGEDEWRMTPPFFFEGGYHVLDVRSQAQTSGDCAVAVDFLEVFNGPPIPRVQATSAPVLPSPQVAQDVARIVLVSAPPTLAPTATPLPPSVISLRVQVAYDANANDTPDLTEGVQGVSVRVVNARTGNVLQSGITDERGQLRLQLLTEDEIIAHMPFLDQQLTLRPTRGQVLQHDWRVLIPPANQPAVVP